MDESIDDYLDELNTFIVNSKNKLQRVLNKLNWTEESLFLSSKDGKENSNSDAGNELEQQPKQDENFSVTEGIPKEPMDSEKLYNEIMASLPQPTKIKQEKDEEKVIREQLAAERDAKRRRISYKNKVHTKNKTHTEILREVIYQQMTALEDWLAQESGTTLESKIDKEEEKELSKKQPNDSELIELGEVGGNCHTVWKHVGEIMRRRLKSEEADEGYEHKRKRSGTCDEDRERKMRRKSSEEPKRKNHFGRESYKEYRLREESEYGNRNHKEDWEYKSRDEREHRKRDDKDRRTKEDWNHRSKNEKEYKKREHRDHRKKKDHRKDHSVERAEKSERRHKSDRYV